MDSAQDAQLRWRGKQLTQVESNTRCWLVNSVAPSDRAVHIHACIEKQYNQQIFAEFQHQYRVPTCRWAGCHATFSMHSQSQDDGLPPLGSQRLNIQPPTGYRYHFANHLSGQRQCGWDSCSKTLQSTSQLRRHLHQFHRVTDRVEAFRA